MGAATRTLRIGPGRRATNAISRLPNSGILVFLSGIAIGMSFGSARVNNLFGADTSPGWWASWLQNFSTEMFGALLVFILLEFIVFTRDRRKRLVWQMGNPDNRLALQAVRGLRAEGWLSDGSLKGVGFDVANLQGAHLSNANLQQSRWKMANLQEALFMRAKLQALLCLTRFERNGPENKLHLSPLT